MQMRNLCGPVLLLACLLWSAPSSTHGQGQDPNKPGPSTSEHGGKAHGTEGGGHETPPGILTIAADTALWSVVVFLLLLFILRKAAWGPILEGLHKREASIRNAAEEAKLARAETEQIRQETRAELDRRSKEIADMMNQARRDAEALKEQMRAEGNAEVQKERQRLYRELEIGKDQALHEIWSQAAQLATLISIKAVGRSLSEDDHRRLVAESLDELNKLKG